MLSVLETGDVLVDFFALFFRGGRSLSARLPFLDRDGPVFGDKVFPSEEFGSWAGASEEAAFALTVALVVSAVDA